MKVYELIRELSQCDPMMEVRLNVRKPKSGSQWGYVVENIRVTKQAEVIDGEEQPMHVGIRGEYKGKYDEP